MERLPGCYTLLADDNSEFSNDPARRNLFKAHIVYNLILNERIAFSDNQVICSSNLQALVAEDEAVIGLFKEGLFDLAVRANFDDESGTASLRAVHKAFLDERKIRFAGTVFDETPLAFVERCTKPIPWTYEDVRSNFTAACERLLLREFRPLLGDEEFEKFTTLIEAEKERDSGLGREFLQNRLHLQMEQEGIAVDEQRRDLIRRCTDAPYLSNLPGLIGLNPIYADEHRSSFDLMRGSRVVLETTDGAKVPSRFDYRHYIEGLCRLTVEDILALRHLPARRSYGELAAGVRNEAGYDDAYRAFIEFNLQVEDRIAARFPEIARHSCGDPDRTFFKQKAKTYLGTGGEDLFGILVGTVCPYLPLATCRQLIFDLWPSSSKPAPQPAGDAVEREMRRRRLEDHLRRAGAAEMLEVEEQPVRESGFSKEIVVS